MAWSSSGSAGTARRQLPAARNPCVCHCAAVLNDATCALTGAITCPQPSPFLSSMYGVRSQQAGRETSSTLGVRTSNVCPVPSFIPGACPSFSCHVLSWLPPVKGFWVPPFCISQPLCMLPAPDWWHQPPLYYIKITSNTVTQPGCFLSHWGKHIK